MFFTSWSKTTFLICLFICLFTSSGNLSQSSLTPGMMIILKITKIKFENCDHLELKEHWNHKVATSSFCLRVQSLYYCRRRITMHWWTLITNCDNLSLWSLWGKWCMMPGAISSSGTELIWSHANVSFHITKSTFRKTILRLWNLKNFLVRVKRRQFWDISSESAFS